MNYLHYDFKTEGQAQLEQVVALLADQGFVGFEEKENNLNAFIPEDDFNEDRFSLVINLFATIAYTKTIVEPINWNKKWEEDFKPVIVDDFVAIRAVFHQPINTVAHEIIITPKMSFGTGHHATTYLMIKQMKEINFQGKSVLDFGTGTGVLAILATKLGAEKIIAIDCDEWSILNAEENIVQNGCSNIYLEQANTISPNQGFDIILANINLNVIKSNVSSIVTCSLTGATILLSGFLKENETALIAELEDAGLQYLLTMQSSEWILIMVKKP